MTETAVCPVCQHEVLVHRDPQNIPRLRGHRDPDDQYRRECGGAGRAVPADGVLRAAWERVR